MSHFSVCLAIPAHMLRGLGITRNRIESFADAFLSPYCEQTEDPAYLVFNDRTEETAHDYETSKIDAVRFPDGHVVSIYNDEFSRYFIVKDGVIQSRINSSFESKETEESRKLTLIPDMPVKDLYTYEAYCSEYCGYRQNAEKRWGYWANPNAKWDWFSIGGRFSRKLLVPIGSKDSLLCVDPKYPAPDGFVYADGAFKRDICWAKLKELTEAAERKEFDRLVNAYDTNDTAALNHALQKKKKAGIYGYNGELVYKAGETYESYRARNGLASEDQYALSPYAFVDKEGNWNSSGDMGWFGISLNEKPAPKWTQQVQEFLSGLADDDYIVILDCHI